MAAFKVFIRKSGETGVEIEVVPDTTVGDIKARHDLVGSTLSYKGQLKNATRMSDIGIQAGSVISVVKTAQTGLKQAESRMKHGQKRSTVHHLALHAQTQAVVVSSVMEESELTRTTVKGESASIKKTLGDVLDIVRGGTTARAPNQSAHDRRKELLVRTLVTKNELADVNEEIKAGKAAAKAVASARTTAGSKGEGTGKAKGKSNGKGKSKGKDKARHTQ